MLHRLVLAVLRIAFGVVHSHDTLTRELFFDFLETRTALRSFLTRSTASVGDLVASVRVGAPRVAGRAVMLLRTVVAILSAAGRVEAGCSGLAALFHDLCVARAFLLGGLMHFQCDDIGLFLAIDLLGVTRTRASAIDLFAGILIDAPFLSGRTPMLLGGEQTVVRALRYVITDHAAGEQEFGTLDVTDGAFRLSVHDRGAIDGLTSVGYNAPAFAGRTVALDGIEVTIIGALWQVFAGHRLTGV